MAEAESMPDAEPTMQEPISASMMAEQHEQEEQRGWFGKFWGIILMIVLIGTIIGVPLWWIWTRSPLRGWLKIVITLLLLGLLVLVI